MFQGLGTCVSGRSSISSSEAQVLCCTLTKISQGHGSIAKHSRAMEVTNCVWAMRDIAPMYGTIYIYIYMCVCVLSFLSLFIYWFVYTFIYLFTYLFIVYVFVYLMRKRWEPIGFWGVRRYYEMKLMFDFLTCQWFWCSSGWVLGYMCVCVHLQTGWGFGTWLLFSIYWE